ncbi:CPBP family intramembrane glutamic endopeptidase [Massilia sp. MS-15]|uniref:CPBP family intramembrane glutamic endopeptidase n=1 Tax=Massilia sp. MS-15 TaxID=2878200 RepID=UPI001CD45B6D|nr:type II CAAX endopeptidase family protein [Massilia sp. MS-15]MCA1248068.1 CPBP family intramembrane metalloprotease [Massilia sp. MS-15]
MTLGMMVEVMMLIAALGFGALAIRHWRAQGTPVLRGLGLAWNRQAGRDLMAGIAIATLAMLGIFAVEAALGATTASGLRQQSLGELGSWLLGKAAASVKEEIIMRGLLLSGLVLALRGRRWLAILLSALAFGCIHLSNPGANPLSVLGNTLGGVVYGVAFLYAGSLWLPIALHFAWNFVQGPLLGFPVSGIDAGGLLRIHDLGPAWLSGGAYGPEAGLVGIAFRFVIIAVVLLWLKSAWRHRSRPWRPAENVVEYDGPVQAPHRPSN